MKFFVPVALLVAAVSAQSDTASASVPSSTSACDAQYILDDCLESTTKKKDDCESTDNACLCYAWQAISTCYNNCPDDPSAASIGSVSGPYCSAFSATNTNTKIASATKTVASATSADATATEVAAEPTSSDNSAADLARNTGGILLAVAGVVAAML